MLGALMTRLIGLHRGVLPIGLLLCVALTVACKPIPLFSPRALEGLDEEFDVAVWSKAPKTMGGRKVELGGRILRAEVRDGETIFVAAHLPIVDDLVYESFEERKRQEEYGVFYRATIDPKWLVPGNHLVVVGVTTDVKTFSFNGTERTLPFVRAECLHVWESAGMSPPALPVAEAEQFAMLAQATYCTSAY